MACSESAREMPLYMPIGSGPNQPWGEHDAEEPQPQQQGRPPVGTQSNPVIGCRVGLPSPRGRAGGR